MASQDRNKQAEETKKKYSEDTWASAEAEKENLQKTHDENVAQAKTKTEEAIDETTDDYLDIVRSADIQKELDLRDIRETRANMGLSRSGLSATEQTAAILSAGNKTAEAQRNRQKAIDALNKSLADYETEQGTKLREGKLSIDNEARSVISKHDSEVDQKVWELESEDYQASVKAEADKYSTYITSQKDNENNRKNDLKALRDDGAIDPDTHAYALVNKLTAKEALRRYGIEKNVKDQEIADYAIVNGLSQDKAIALDEHGFTANRICNQNGSVEAVLYLQDKFKSGDLTEYDVRFIAGQIGLTEEDFEKAKTTSEKER